LGPVIYTVEAEKKDVAEFAARNRGKISSAAPTEEEFSSLKAGIEVAKSKCFPVFPYSQVAHLLSDNHNGQHQ